MERLKIAIDIDGVITANPSALSWLTFHLKKNENNVDVYVVTWRDGSDEKRVNQTYEELKAFGIYFNEVIFAPQHFANAKTAALWKIAKINELGVNIWIDDEIKSYRRDYGIDLDFLLPDVHKIWI